MDHGSHDGHGIGGFDGHGNDAITGHMSGVDFGFGHDHGHAGATTADALCVAHSFCADHDGSIAVDNGVSLDGHFGGHGMMSAMGASFAGALNPSNSAFGIAVVGHDYLDHRTIVRQLLTKAGLLELFTPLGDRKRVDQSYEVIKPVRAATKSKSAVMPSGYYDGATGLTREWRSFWQIGKHTFADRLLGNPRTRDPKARWNIDVSITQWFYAESGDYETRILASVWSGFMNTTTDIDERLAHLVVARQFIKEMADTIGAVSPNEHTRRFRAALKGDGAVQVDPTVTEVAEEVQQVAVVA
ncbi:MAG: hypothetical protein WC714_19300 [Candidatus Obscuribacterales bacterium]|jgi:hypothetical protein